LKNLAMSVGHYENFPVASILLPARLRQPVGVVYRFARTADDFADEGDLAPADRLARLEGYRDELRRIQRSALPQTPLFEALADVVREHGLPLRPFFDLLDAFSQDVIKARYANFPEVLDYCRRSADPVGRLMLHLYGAAGEENFAQSDSICSALQLVNFWQDIAIDFRKNRIYLPQDDMARYGIPESRIAAADAGGRWPELMRFQTERARAMLESGAPLAERLPGRIGLELRMIIQGGLRILDKLDAVRGDVYHRRPVLRPLDWPLMMLRALGVR
jgi:squalene synthase HpnC